MGKSNEKIFKIFGVQENEPFMVRTAKGIEGPYCINHDFYIIPLSSRAPSCFTIIDVLNGKCVIKKSLFYTAKDKIILEYAKLCGCKYIAKDENGVIFSYRSKPTKGDGVWESDKGFMRIDADTSLCSWEDEEALEIEKILKEGELQE